MTPLCITLRFNAHVSAANAPRRVNAGWAFADMVAFFFKEIPRRRKKLYSSALRKRNIAPFGRGIAEQLGGKRGPSGSALAVCVWLILLAVRGQIETQQ